MRRIGDSMKRNSVGAWLIVGVTLASPARADVTYTALDDNSMTIVRMTVTPAAEPVPALKYRLIERDIDLKPGNSAPYYYRALLDSTRTMDRVRKEFGDEFDTWYIGGGDSIPIGDLPLDKVRNAVQMSSDPIRDHLLDATQRRDCDWELGVEDKRGVDVVAFLLPEFQECRDLGRILSLQSRLATAERRYDDAIDAMRMNYRLGSDVAKEPFLVCGLIGIAIDGITNGTVTELIAAPDSPNLYWALTELPQPIIDLRSAVRFEIDFGPRTFPFIHHAETTDHSPQEWNRLLTQAIRDLQKAGGMTGWFGGMPSVENDAAAGLAATAIALLGYPHAKQQLIAQGMDPERVEKMAVGQVIAIYTERTYQRFSEDWHKLWYVPFAEVDKREDPLVKRLAEARFFSNSQEREVLPLVSLLLPAMQAARTAQVRLERDVATLRVIEALRMYAADHDGRLPESLDAIDKVPVPDNPVTGQPFVYRLEGQTAILELPPSDRIPGYNRRFEIQIAEGVK